MVYHRNHVNLSHPNTESNRNLSLDAELSVDVAPSVVWLAFFLLPLLRLLLATKATTVKSIAIGRDVALNT